MASVFFIHTPREKCASKDQLKLFGLSSMTKMNKKDHQKQHIKPDKGLTKSHMLPSIVLKYKQWSDHFSSAQKKS